MRDRQTHAAPSPATGLHSAEPVKLYYGGTFDPIHNGHLAIAEAAHRELGVPVQLVPAADPPHRALPGANARQRAQMLALAIAGRPGLVLDERELRRAEHSDVPSYTVDTLIELRQGLGPDVPLAWLLGADSFVGLPSWHRWRELLALAHLVVAERPGSPVDGALASELAAALDGHWASSLDSLTAVPAGLVWRLHQPLREESATEVRRMVREGGAWRTRVPGPVADYIVAERLYGGADPAA